MSILWCGGEDIDFPNYSGLAVIRPDMSEAFRAEYCRATLYSLPKSTSNAFAGGPVTSAWLSAQMYIAVAGSSHYVLDETWIIGLVKDPTTLDGIVITINGSDPGAIAISKTSSGVITPLVTASIALDAYGVAHLYKLDLEISNYGASSTINLYINQVLWATFSGDCTVAGVTDLSAVCIGGQSDIYHGYAAVSEIIIADEDTRAFPGLFTIIPNAQGTTDQWTGDYSTVNTVGASEDNPNYSNTISQDQQFNPAPFASGAYIVKALKTSAFATKTADAAAIDLALGYSDGITTVVGSTNSLDTSYKTYEQLDSTNPITSQPFVQTEMNALQFDLRTVSVI